MKTIARSSRRPAAPRSLRRGLLLAGSVALLVAALPEVALLRAAGLIDGRRDAEAARWLAVADRLSPRRGAVHFHAARLARRRHDFAAVHRRLQAAFDAGWPVADLEREQWLAMAETGNVEEMQRHWADLFSDPRTDGPEISRAYVVAALARIRLRDARRVLDAWAADHPDDAGPHFFRGMIHAIQLEWEDAGRAYARCLELDPRHNEARRGLAESFAKRLRFGEALEEWTRLLALDPADTAAAVGRCDCLVQLGEADAAQRELAGLLERRPGDVAVLELAGRLELAAGTPARAVDLLSRAVAERPEDAELRYALGRALRLAGDADAARDHLAYREAAAEPLDRLRRLLVQLPHKPWDADIRAEIGELTTAWKSRAEGRQWFLRALDVDPEHPRARAALAHAEAAAAPAAMPRDARADTGTINAGSPGDAAERPSQ